MQMLVLAMDKSELQEAISRLQNVLNDPRFSGGMIEYNAEHTKFKTLVTKLTGKGKDPLTGENQLGIQVETAPLKVEQNKHTYVLHKHYLGNRLERS